MAQDSSGRPPKVQGQGSRKPPREVDVAELTQDGREVILRHNGERYRLRITANDKLILTK